MKCPDCGSPMTYTEGEDEFSTNELHWYAVWWCECGNRVRDYEEEFEFPDDDKGLKDTSECYPGIEGPIVISKEQP